LAVQDARKAKGFRSYPLGSTPVKIMRVQGGAVRLRVWPCPMRYNALLWVVVA